MEPDPRDLILRVASLFSVITYMGAFTMSVRLALSYMEVPALEGNIPFFLGFIALSSLGGAILVSAGLSRKISSIIPISRSYSVVAGLLMLAPVILALLYSIQIIGVEYTRAVAEMANSTG